jgi:molybdopterin molybdotransferase
VTTVEEALRIVAAETPAMGSERVPLCDGLGRVLAEPIASDVDWPPFDTSAMDGYAVRLADAENAGTPLSERKTPVAAGEAPPEPLTRGEAVRVMTGAPLPAGAEAVIPVEQSRRGEGRVRFEVVPKAGAHVRRMGESIRKGTLLLAAGRRLTPADLALAALAGADPLAVVGRPRVLVAATGDELVAATETPDPGKIRDSNGPMLLALCRARGWPARSLPSVRDDASGVATLFERAGAQEDVLVTSGGVSAGDFDLLPGAARREGFEILFHGISLRPGKPLVFARRGATLWFGLPGNPVSSSVCFQLFVRFALDRLEGDASPGARRIQARLARELRAGEIRETYRDAALSFEDGVALAEPLGSIGSHDIAMHARANALIRVPAQAGPLRAGTVVECVMLEP